jgi:hypothetical protein
MKAFTEKAKKAVKSISEAISKPKNPTISDVSSTDNPQNTNPPEQVPDSAGASPTTNNQVEIPTTDGQTEIPTPDANSNPEKPSVKIKKKAQVPYIEEPVATPQVPHEKNIKTMSEKIEQIKEFFNEEKELAENLLADKFIKKIHNQLSAIRTEALILLKEDPECNLLENIINKRNGEGECADDKEVKLLIKYLTSGNKPYQLKDGKQALTLDELDTMSRDKDKKKQTLQILQQTFNIKELLKILSDKKGQVLKKFNDDISLRHNACMKQINERKAELFDNPNQELKDRLKTCEEKYNVTSTSLTQLLITAKNMIDLVPDAEKEPTLTDKLKTYQELLNQKDIFIEIFTQNLKIKEDLYQEGEILESDFLEKKITYYTQTESALTEMKQEILNNLKILSPALREVDDQRTELKTELLTYLQEMKTAIENIGNVEISPLANIDEDEDPSLVQALTAYKNFLQKKNQILQEYEGWKSIETNYRENKLTEIEFINKIEIIKGPIKNAILRLNELSDQKDLIVNQLNNAIREVEDQRTELKNQLQTYLLEIKTAIENIENVEISPLPNIDKDEDPSLIEALRVYKTFLQEKDQILQEYAGWKSIETDYRKNKLTEIEFINKIKIIKEPVKNAIPCLKKLSAQKGLIVKQLNNAIREVENQRTELKSQLQTYLLEIKTAKTAIDNVENEQSKKHQTFNIHMEKDHHLVEALGAYDNSLKNKNHILQECEGWESIETDYRKNKLTEIEFINKIKIIKEAIPRLKALSSEISSKVTDLNNAIKDILAQRIKLIEEYYTYRKEFETTFYSNIRKITSILKPLQQRRQINNEIRSIRYLNETIAKLKEEFGELRRVEITAEPSLPLISFIISKEKEKLNGIDSELTRVLQQANNLNNGIESNIRANSPEVQAINTLRRIITVEIERLDGKYSGNDERIRLLRPMAKGLTEAINNYCNNQTNQNQFITASLSTIRTNISEENLRNLSKAKNKFYKFLCKLVTPITELKIFFTKPPHTTVFFATKSEKDIAIAKNMAEKLLESLAPTESQGSNSNNTARRR